MTGLITDEDGIAWNKEENTNLRIFNEPWVICEDLNKDLLLYCDELLTHTSILIRISTWNNFDRIEKNGILYNDEFPKLIKYFFLFLKLQ